MSCTRYEGTTDQPVSTFGGKWWLKQRAGDPLSRGFHPSHGSYVCCLQSQFKFIAHENNGTKEGTIIDDTRSTPKKNEVHSMVHLCPLYR